MNRVANPILMLMPEELMGALIMFMLVAGGLAIIVGARRAGTTLVTTAIAIPFVNIIVEALMNDMFALLPDALVTPLAFLLTLAIWLAVGWMLLKIVFGQKAIDEAKGHLLADGIKWVLAFLVRLPVLVTAVMFFSYFAWAR